MRAAILVEKRYRSISFDNLTDYVWQVDRKKRNNVGLTDEVTFFLITSNFFLRLSIAGGNVLAWGNNNLAQLGRAPANPKESEEKLIFKFKSSKRIIRCINHTDRLMAIDTTPSQVPNIPSPTISYQSYDVTPLAGSIQPLSYIEHSWSDLTLHYALEQFHGLFSTFKILNKVCIF